QFIKDKLIENGKQTLVFLIHENKFNYFTEKYVNKDKDKDKDKNKDKKTKIKDKDKNKITIKTNKHGIRY
uniref:hypothetical protein n=1 Tax=Prevotella sp. TaxID=59823 RepID=UPI00307BF8EC